MFGDIWSWVPAARVMADRGKSVAPNDVADDLKQGLRSSQLFPWLMRSLVADMGAHAGHVTASHES